MAPHRVVGMVLKGALDTLGITKYQVGQLMGIPEPTMAYKWYAGRFRPSHEYAFRFAFLYYLDHVLDGRLHELQSIEWTEGGWPLYFHWKDGDRDATHFNDLYDGRWPLPYTPIPNDPDIPAPGAQRPRPPGSHSARNADVHQGTSPPMRFVGRTPGRTAEAAG